MSQTVKLRRSATSGSVPTTSALALGELAINTYDGKLYLKKNVSGTETIVEIGANNLADTFHIYEYSVTANTTVFQGSDDNSHTLSYTTGSPPRIAVFLNGLLLDWGTDFTATNGSSVTLSSAAVSGDLVQIQAYKSTVVAGSNLMFGDNVKAQFGDDGDLEIYHDGTRSIINDVGTGNLQFQVGGTAIYDVTTDGIVLATGLDVEANEFIGDLRGSVLFKAQAGEALSKGDVVTITGISGNTTVVSKADADDASLMPAFGVAAETVSINAPVDIYSFGIMSNLTTNINGWTEGSPLYVSTTPGEMTNVPPGGSASLVQQIAKITKIHASTGSIDITGAGRANATPNLDEGKIFVGNSSNRSVQVDSTITVDMANSQVLVDGALSIEGGSFTSGLETASDVGIVIQKNDYIYSDDNNYLRKIIGHTSTNHIEIGQSGTVYIGDINLRPGASGNIKLFGSGSEDFKVDSSGNTTMNGTATINNAVTGDASQFTILNGAGATLRMGITGSGANEAAHIKTNAGEALEFHIGQASNATTPDIEFLADGAGIDFQGVNILNSSRNITTNSRLTFDFNDHYLEAGTNSLALKNSSGTSYLVASNTGLSVTGTLSSTGDLTVGGNLTVNGTTTTLNTATLSVDDLNITIADGAANAAAANGAGITVDGASATLTYTSAEDRWNFNKKLYVPDNIRIAAGGPQLILQDTTDDDDHAIRFMDNGGTNRMSITTLGDNLNFETTGSRNFTFKGNTSGAGQVLIGDSTSYHPAAQLQIVGGGSTTSATYARMLLKDADGTSQHAFIEETGGSFNITAQNGTSDGTIKFSQYDGTTTSTRMTIEPGGNVGINETNPTAKLHIVESSTNAGALNLYNGTSWLRMVPNLGAGGYTGLSAAGDIGIIFSIDNDNTTDSSSNGLLIAPHTQTNGGLKILENGNVGIGVASPSKKLTISGDIRITNGSAYMSQNVAGSTRSLISLGTDNVLRIKGNDSEGSNNVISMINGGDVGIGTTSPTDRLHVYENVNRTSIKVQNDNHSSKFEAYGNATAITTDASNGLFLRISDVNKVHLDNNGNFGVNVSNPKAKFQVEEYGIDTTETSTSATTQTVIHTMSASDFRSARFTIQVTNSTDSTYHTTEILMVHDGTNANITEFGKVFTANEEATFDADVSAGNVRLFATPATTDSMEFKVVCHSITV